MYVNNQPLRAITALGAAIAAPVAAATPARHAPAKPPAAAPAATTAQAVRIDNFTFNAPLVTVKVGTTVTWTNGDDIPHTVVAKNLAFKSRVLDTGDTFSFTFTKPGDYGYFCSLHPHMTGRIVVRA